MGSKRDTFHYFLFDANAEEENNERMPHGMMMSLFLKR